MTRALVLPCSYRTCRRPAAVVVSASGTLGSYSAGACDQHTHQMAARAAARAGVVATVEPVRNPPPPPQDEAAPLF
jgi:hypothetical protein